MQIILGNKNRKPIGSSQYSDSITMDTYKNQTYSSRNKTITRYKYDYGGIVKILVRSEVTLDHPLYSRIVDRNWQNRHLIVDIDIKPEDIIKTHIVSYYILSLRRDDTISTNVEVFDLTEVLTTASGMTKSGMWFEYGVGFQQLSVDMNNYDLYSLYNGDSLSTHSVVKNPFKDTYKNEGDSLVPFNPKYFTLDEMVYKYNNIDDEYEVIPDISHEEFMNGFTLFDMCNDKNTKSFDVHIKATDEYNRLTLLENFPDINSAIINICTWIICHDIESVELSFHNGVFAIPKGFETFSKIYDDKQYEYKSKTILNILDELVGEDINSAIDTRRYQLIVKTDSLLFTFKIIDNMTGKRYDARITRPEIISYIVDNNVEMAIHEIFDEVREGELSDDYDLLDNIIYSGNGNVKVLSGLEPVENLY